VTRGYTKALLELGTLSAELGMGGAGMKLATKGYIKAVLSSELGARNIGGVMI